MLKLYSTTKIVKEILKDIPEARNSDSRLYYEVAKRVGAKQGVDILNRSFGGVLLSLAAFNLPTFETVRRTRQKVQSLYKELGADDTVSAYRVINEEEYRDYALTVKEI